VISGGFLKLESLDFWMTPSPYQNKAAIAGGCPAEMPPQERAIAG
jgi:hypothetical protein